MFDLKIEKFQKDETERFIESLTSSLKNSRSLKNLSASPIRYEKYKSKLKLNVVSDSMDLKKNENSK